MRMHAVRGWVLARTFHQRRRFVPALVGAMPWPRDRGICFDTVAIDETQA
jgi:hypothetical protein